MRVSTSVRTPTFFSSSAYSPPTSMTSDAARAQHGHAGGRLGHFHEHEPLPVRRRAPVVLDGLVDDPVAAHVLDELPRPGADRAAARRRPRPALSMCCLDWMNADRGEEALGHLVAEGHERLLEAQGDRVRVLDLHALDQPELRGQRVRRALLRERGEREPHVVRRQRAAVVELDALAEVEGPRAAAVGPSSARRAWAPARPWRRG